jgi:hypothetical protein
MAPAALLDPEKLCEDLPLADPDDFTSHSDRLQLQATLTKRSDGPDEKPK